MQGSVEQPLVGRVQPDREVVAGRRPASRTTREYYTVSAAAPRNGRNRAVHPTVRRPGRATGRVLYCDVVMAPRVRPWMTGGAGGGTVIPAPLLWRPDRPTEQGQRGMTLQRLKWLTLTAPLLFLAGLLVAQRRLPDLLTWWPGYLLIAGVSLTATLFFNEAIFSVINRLQQQVVQRNRELLALHEAGLDIAEELDLETLLQRVVDRTAALVGAPARSKR
jgi:hypothetical protein